MRALLVLILFAAPAGAQQFTYRGFAQVQLTGYAQETPQDDERAVAEALLRFEPAYRPVEWLTLSGSFDARADSIAQAEREWRIDVRDLDLLRPALSVRHAQATLRKGTLAVDLGRQFVRWGKADILNPTDRFAPRDFLEVTDDEFLAVIGARGQYERGAQSFDVVWVPTFTPSRTPLIGRRWAPLSPETLGDSGYSGFVDLDPVFPKRSQYGARWNVVGPGFEGSVSYFDGFNHLPQYTAIPLSDRPLVALRRTYASLRMVGADGAVPLRWLTVKGEVAALFSTRSEGDDVVAYVIQVERQSGELSLVAGYAGEVVTDELSTFDFAPDRGLTRAFLGRLGYTIGPTSDVSFEAAVRHNLDGVWLKGQYSRAVGTHWRATFAGAVIGGDERDFIGQYHRNSHVFTTLRYSF